LRMKLGRMLIKLGLFLQSLPVVVMKPEDLTEFSRQTYAKPDDVESWAEDSLVDAGLNKGEQDLLADLPETRGDLLLLGVGGGREAIPLAKMGFRVTGVDFIPDLVARAIENAERRGVSMDGLVQEISQLEVPDEAYDVVWLSRAMYSCVPGRQRRVAMVRRVAKALKPGGTFLCQFRMDPRMSPSKRGVRVRRLIAALTFGNRSYEAGDLLLFNIEFLHAFSSIEQVRGEIEDGGLEVIRFQQKINPVEMGVVCRKQ